jgi:predicted RNA-binding Zn-ribbon protein involved in translation (DUF1610 family)
MKKNRGARWFGRAIMERAKKRVKVRAERIDTKCGSIEHMTVEEIVSRLIGKEVNLTCPECGEIHLTREDAEHAKKKKFSATARFKKIKQEAEGA